MPHTLPESFSGSCLCQSVTFTISSQPDFRYLCHCPSCKKTSGSAFMHNWNFNEDAVTYTSGAENITTYSDKNTNSGNPLERSFCRNCGSAVAIRTKIQPGKVMIPAGVLDGEGVQDPEPETENYADERVKWVGFAAAKQMGGGSRRKKGDR